MSAGWIAFLKTAGSALVAFLLVWFPAHVGLLPIDPAYQGIIASIITALAHNLQSPAQTAASANTISTSGR